MQEAVATRTLLPTVAPHGAAARVFLSFLATAGLFYVNIMPAIVDGLIEGLGFSPKAAGLVGSANVYGAALGALAIVFLIGRLNWRRTAYALLGTLILMDLLSILILLPGPLMAFRFVHGVVGGGLVGVAFAVIARTVNPDRTFGVLLVVQFGLGGLGNLYLPRLVPFFGPKVLFIALIAFSVATLLMLPFLGEYPRRKAEAAEAGALPPARARLPVFMVLASVFLFQAANMGLFAFIIGLGRDYGLELPFITTTLALAGWIGIVGPVIVIAIYTRFGRFLPLVAAMLLTMLGTWALHYSALPAAYFAANTLVGITWAFVMPYLLGLCSEFDTSGRMAALGGFASKMGLASGPLAAGLLLGDDNYGLLIDVAVVALLASAIASVIPARLYDRKRTEA
jgi:MFS transporter, DHA1 family, inner membrane transport protein